MHGQGIFSPSEGSPAWRGRVVVLIYLVQVQHLRIGAPPADERLPQLRSHSMDGLEKQTEVCIVRGPQPEEFAVRAPQPSPVALYGATAFK